MATPEEIEVQRQQEQEKIDAGQENVITEPPVVPAEGEPEPKAEGSPDPQPKTFVDGKYQTPEELERGYKELLEQNNKVEKENSQFRDHLTRESESQEQAAESTSEAEAQKTLRQNAEDLMRKGDYVGAQKLIADDAAKSALKPIEDRQKAADQARRAKDGTEAFESLSKNEKEFPGFLKLESEMNKLYKTRLAANENYDDSFASPKELIMAMYFEVKARHPELLSQGRGIAGAMSQGSGAGARTPGLAPVSQEKKQDWQKDKRWSDLDMPPNQYQFDKSEEDLENERVAAESHALAKLLAGQTA